MKIDAPLDRNRCSGFKEGWVRYFFISFCVLIQLVRQTAIWASKIMKNHQNDHNRGPRRVPKSIPNRQKSGSGLQGVLWGVPGNPWATKMGPRVPKWSLRASQMADLGIRKHPFQHPAGSASPANHASPTSHQSTGCQRGRWQGAKPLR